VRRKYFRFGLYIIVLLGFSSASADPKIDFFRAVNIDNDGAVRQLLEAGFDPNSVNPQGLVGLFLAMREESFKVAALLVAHPAIRIDAVSPADETPLMMACLKGHRDWARRLLGAGAALNRPGWTPLHYAASGPDAALVGDLLERGADVNAESPNRSTPLMMAARYGAEAAADLLLLKGADARARNERGLTAADFARTAGRVALALRIEGAAR
jgi:ankyrin repeat protein